MSDQVEISPSPGMVGPQWRIRAIRDLKEWAGSLRFNPLEVPHGFRTLVSPTHVTKAARWAAVRMIPLL